MTSESRIRYRTVQTSRFRFVDCWMPPGSSVHAHGHASHHACFIADGAFRQSFPDRERTLATGNLRLSPEGAEHDLVAERCGARLLILHPIDGTRSPRTAELFRSTEIVQRPELSSLRARISQALAVQRPSPLVLEELADELFAAVRLYRVRRGPVEPPAWLLRVRRRIHFDPLAAPSVEEMARIAGVHRVHLSRSFQMYLGCSLKRFIQRRRLVMGWQRLGEPGMELARLSLESGFSDQSHFTRVFSHHLAVSPGRYRRSGAAGDSLPWQDW